MINLCESNMHPTSWGETTRVKELAISIIPHTLIGNNGTCPDHFMIYVSGLNMPMFQKTVHRIQNEDDCSFWDRVLFSAGELSAEVRLKSTGSTHAPDYQIEIYCDYGLNDETEYTDGLKNFENLLWSTARNGSANSQGYALSILYHRYSSS